MALPQHCLNSAIRRLSIVGFVLVLFLTVFPHPVTAMVGDGDLDRGVENTNDVSKEAVQDDNDGSYNNDNNVGCY